MIDKTVFKDKKAVYYTLGCKLNFSETATIERQLQEAGIRTAKRGEVADICVVNSCAVTQEAEKKCRQAIHKLVRQHPGAFVVVTGCYAQLSAEKLAAEPGVGVVLGIDKKGQVLEYVLKNLETKACGEWFVQQPRMFATLCTPVQGATAPAISSRCRMAVTTTAPTVPSPLHVDVAVTPRLRNLWSRHAMRLPRAARRW